MTHSNIITLGENPILRISFQTLWNYTMKCGAKVSRKEYFLCPDYQTTIVSSSFVLNLFHFPGFSLNNKNPHVDLLPYTEKISLAWWNDLRQHCKTTIYTQRFLGKCPREMRLSQYWARQTFAVLAVSSRKTQTASTYWHYVIPWGNVAYLLPSFAENIFFYAIHSDIVLFPMSPSSCLGFYLFYVSH